MPTKRLLIMLDVEANGPVPGLYSMLEFGAVVVEDTETMRSFYGALPPLPDADIHVEAAGIAKSVEQPRWQEAMLSNVKLLLASERSIDPESLCQCTMENFHEWAMKTVVREGQYCEIISDNNGFDWAFLNWYFHRFWGPNPFGHTSRNLNDLFKGVERNMRASFKSLRKAPHDHHPVHDAMGNAEALVKIVKEYQLQGVF